ncbi:MAG: methionyl-tRNA formyltransferase [Archangium sp.]|nr:methionyl-tRNA formyltransferase [Archangium sp.]MDP3156980.1 methionyl-tRNA formyltransferase [Archangium sp.]MDP3574761.1 methionyl-tRNA formyltransferase [Archangium sp.]
MRIVFMGTPAFAVKSLEACLSLGEVVAVVTQPDKPRGRGQEVSFSPVKELALAKGLPVLQPLKIRGTNFAEELRALNADVGVVTAYGKILPQDVLDAPRRGCVNVHASLLPRFRGAAPIQWAIAAGDEKTGVCLMQMDAGMDTGGIIDCAELTIGAEDTSASMHDKLSDLGGDVLERSLQRYVDGALPVKPQPTEGVVMAPMIKKEDGRLDWSKRAVELERRLRAFTPWPGAFCTFEGALLKVAKASAAEGKSEPGTVLAVTAEGIEVACAEGSLVLQTLQPEGKRAMTAKEFLAGRKLTVGSKPFA